VPTVGISIGATGSSVAAGVLVSVGVSTASASALMGLPLSPRGMKSQTRNSGWAI